MKFSFIKLITITLASLSIVSFAIPLKVGIVVGPQIQVFQLVKKIAKDKYNLDIQTVVFADYQSPNEALNAGNIDANVFQTNIFLQRAIEKRGYKLTVIGNTFIYPMGIYSKKIKKLSDLKEKSIIAIPNDPSNQSRALILLKQAQLIDFKAGTEEAPTPRDIVSNKKNLNIKSLDAAQIARSAEDVDAIALNNDFINNAGFKAKDALFKEDPAHATPYINVIVAQTKSKDQKELKELIQILHSEAVIQKTQELNPGAVKAW